jgi:PST family polysaccharide transporter
MKVATGVAFMSAGNIVRFGLQLFILPLLARMLGPQVYGLASFAMPLISLASLISDTGLSSAVAGGATMSVAIESNIFWVSIASGGALALLISLIAVPLGHLSGQMAIIPVIIGMSPLLVFSAATTLPNGLITRRHEFWAFMVGDILSFILSSFAAIVLALEGFGIWSLVAQMLVVAVVKFVWLFWVSRPAITWRMWPSEIRGLISFGLDVVGANVCAFIGRNVDNLIIGWAIGLTDLGWYAMAYQIIGMPGAIVSGPIVAVVYPRLGKISGDLAAVRESLLTSVSIVAAILTPVFVGLGATADLAIPLVLGAKWLPTVRLIQLLGLSGWLSCIYSIFYTALLATGRSRDQLRIHAYLALATAVGVAIGAMFGAVGVGVGVSLAAVSAAPWYFRLVHTHWAIGATEILGALAAPAAGAISMLVVLATLRGAGLDRLQPLAELPLLVAIGCVAYVGSFMAFGQRSILSYLAFVRNARDRGAAA